MTTKEIVLFDVIDTAAVKIVNGNTTRNALVIVTESPEDRS